MLWSTAVLRVGRGLVASFSRWRRVADGGVARLRPVVVVERERQRVASVRERERGRLGVSGCRRTQSPPLIVIFLFPFSFCLMLAHSTNTTSLIPYLLL